MTTIGENFRDKVDRLVAEYIEELKEENKTLKDKIEFLTNCLDDRDKSIELMKEENKKLKESLDIATKCSSKEEDGIIRLSEENKKLKDELDIWKYTARDYARLQGVNLPELSDI